MSKSYKKFYAEDGLTVIKTEETQIIYQSNDINKIIKKITNYDLNGKIASNEETEELFNIKTGEKIKNNTQTISQTINQTNSNKSNHMVSYYPIPVQVHNIATVHPVNGIYNDFGRFLTVNYPNLIFCK